MSTTWGLDNNHWLYTHEHKTKVMKIVNNRHFRENKRNYSHKLVVTHKPRCDSYISEQHLTSQRCDYECDSHTSKSHLASQRRDYECDSHISETWLWMWQSHLRDVTMNVTVTSHILETWLNVTVPSRISEYYLTSQKCDSEIWQSHLRVA